MESQYPVYVMGSFRFVHGFVSGSVMTTVMDMDMYSFFPSSDSVLLSKAGMTSLGLVSLFALPSFLFVT